LAYSHTSLTEAKTELSRRLHDTGKVFFVDAELEIYIKEALRTWQTLTAYWRERGVFATTADTAFYDINSQLSSIRGFTIKDQDLLGQIQYHLLETYDVDAWSGTDMFILTDVVNALQRRRNQFLAETGSVVTRSTLAAPSTPISRVTLPDDIIDLRRVSWYNTDNVHSLLWREDEWALAAFSASLWTTTPTTPYAYSVTATPPVSMQVSPVPLDKGTMEILAVENPANLDVSGSGTLMNIPDDFCWIVKWGALADLLGKDGPAMDQERADYCEKRYQQGVDIARMQSCIIQAELQGIPLIVDSMHDLDSFDPDWRNKTGTPADIGTSGMNIIGLSPVPDNVYSVTLDVVRNAPVGAQLQVGREELDAILGYAEHLAMFKVAGPEWQATNIFWENMLQMSLSYNERLAAASRYAVPIADQSRNEKYNRPRRKVAEALISGEAN
jgi:hypothetical protein